MTTLRSLINEIKWDIDSGALEEAHAATDDFSEGVVEADEYVDDLGARAVDTGDMTTASFDEATASVDELGQEGAASADEITSSFDETTGVLDEMGDTGMGALSGLQAGIAGVMGTGFVMWLWDAATALETAEARMRFFVGTADEMDILNEAIQDTIEYSRGIYRRADLLGAAHQAAIYSMEVEQIADVMDDMAVFAAATGQDLERIFFGLGRAIDTGTVRVLERMGVSFRDEMYAMEDQLGESFRQWDRARRELFVLERVQEQAAEMQGEYNNYLETGAARMTALHSAIGDITEIMGTPLISPIATAAEYLRDLLDTIQDEEWGEFGLEIAGWGAFGLAAAAGMYGLGKAAIWLGKTVLAPILKYAAYLGLPLLALEDLYQAWHLNEDTVSASLYNILADLFGADRDFRTWVMDQRVGIRRMYSSWEDFADDFGPMYGQFLDNTVELQSEWHDIIWDRLGGAKEGWGEFVDDTIRLQSEWRETIGESIDDVAGWFRELPGRVAETLSDFGASITDPIRSGLQSVRDFLPFSPAKEGPLVDLDEAGTNIVHEVQHGVEMARPLDLEPILRDYRPEPVPAGAQAAPGGGVNVSVGNINVEVTGDVTDPRRTGRDIGQAVAKAIDDEFRRIRLKMQ